MENLFQREKKMKPGRLMVQLSKVLPWCSGPEAGNGVFERAQAGTYARVQGGHYGYVDEQVIHSLCLNGPDYESGLRFGRVFKTG